jgi:putative MATE family efflux protein
MRSATTDLTRGPVFSGLIKLALPIFGSGFASLAYAMASIFWLGWMGGDKNPELGSQAQSAVGTACFYTWLGFCLVTMMRIGANVGVAQSMGAREPERAARLGTAAMQLGAVFSLLFSLVIIIFATPLIGFFKLDPDTAALGVSFLRWVGITIVFQYLTAIWTEIYNGCGNSRTPFWFNLTGFIFNIVLDPFLILGWGPFPEMGVTGAAIATILAQLLVFVLFAWYWRRRAPLALSFRRWPGLDAFREVVRLGFPVAAQNTLFCCFAIALGRIIAGIDETAIGVQRIGAQIEGLSWMTGQCFMIALGSFTGQNLGAGQWSRIRKGWIEAMLAMGGLGICTSLLLIFEGDHLFALFSHDPRSLAEGTVYMRILGFSQFFMCIELICAGAFNGLGRAAIPASISIIFTGARIPAAFWLSGTATGLGISGVWWAISGSSIVKGIIMGAIAGWFIWKIRKNPDDAPIAAD